MNWIKCIIAGLLLSSITAHAQEDRFHRAQAAYDDARYAEAILRYEELLNEGIENPEVHYNLANACFKDSDLPKAVLHYRTAWYDLPRDPDIKANLHFALNAAGAIEPAPGLAQRTLLSLSRAEWILAATAGYIFLTVLLMMLLFFSSARRPILKLCLVPVALILVSVLGWLQWRTLEKNPEWVVIKTEATALFGPVEGSTAHFKLPIGALVRQRQADAKGWVQVEYDRKQGWLKQEYIAPVSP